jgi:hypothetical protein
LRKRFAFAQAMTVEAVGARGAPAPPPTGRYPGSPRRIRERQCHNLLVVLVNDVSRPFCLQLVNLNSTSFDKRGETAQLSDMLKR